jgi:trehalose synthase
VSTATLTEVELGTAPLARFAPLIGPARQAELEAAAARTAARMEGRTMWHVNSTPSGGGVAELLTALLPYFRGAGIATRWLVIDGDEEFFAVSKRIHNHLHGDDGDGGQLDDEAQRVYAATLERNAADLRELVQPGDVVILQDPQTAGLTDCASALGASVAWRCHVGVDEPNALARGAWDFLRPHVRDASRLVFTRVEHAWEGLDEEKLRIIPPSIDAFTPKNQDLAPATVDAILAAAGLVASDSNGTEPTFTRGDGNEDVVRRRVHMPTGPVPAGRPVIVQISRWDALKDPVGLIRGFAAHVAPHVDAHLVVAGPQADSVDDDPEQADQLAEVMDNWQGLPDGVRAHVHIASLPMDDDEENAAIVNALQRRADVVVQKSLAEGFGLTVAEAMWKKRPVVASARGGIVSQITDDETGVLLRDPEDPVELGAALRGLVQDPERAARLGDAAHQRVCDEFLAPRELLQHFALVDELID